MFRSYWSWPVRPDGLWPVLRWSGAPWRRSPVRAPRHYRSYSSRVIERFLASPLFSCSRQADTRNITRVWVATSRVIAHSLIADGDLRIENNHEARHYEPFWPAVLPPHFLQRGIDRVIYSIHAPGLPVLLLPFYAIAGHWGAMVFVVLLSSLVATSVFRLAERLTDRRVAWVTWVAVALTIPFAPQSWPIFPEMPAALVMAWVAAWLFGPLPTRAATWIWRGAVIAFLPWLHMKYSFLLVGATVCLLIRLWPRVADAARLLAPMTVSGLLWFSSFYVMYGTPNPTVVYGYGAGAGLELSNVPRGILGLLFDQEFGLLLYSPVYALAVVGAWMMLRRPDTRWPALGLLATAGGFVLTVVPYYMWWGGWSVPARFLLPVLPVAAPMIAVAFGRCRGAASRGVSGLLLLASVVSFAVVIYQPQRRLLFNERDGSGRLVEAIQGGIDLTVVLPSFIEPDWVSQLPLVGGWLAAGAMACAAGSRRVTLRRAFWSGVLCLVGFVKAGSLVSGESLRRHNDRDVVSKGQQAAIAAFDGDRLSAYDYRDRRRLDLVSCHSGSQHKSSVSYARPGCVERTVRCSPGSHRRFSSRRTACRRHCWCRGTPRWRPPTAARSDASHGGAASSSVPRTSVPPS